MTIAFLTDGQVGDGPKLPKIFSDILQSAWSGPVDIHVIGL